MKKYIENTTAATIFVGGKMIPPGEGREIDVADLPPEHQVQAAAAPVVVADETRAHVLELLAMGMPVERFQESLQSWPLDALLLAAQLEAEAEQPRAGYLSAIEAERIRRADASLQGQAGDAAGDGDVPTAEQWREQVRLLDADKQRELLEDVEGFVHLTAEELMAAESVLAAAIDAHAKLPGNTGEAKRQQRAAAVTEAQAHVDRLNVQIGSDQARVAFLRDLLGIVDDPSTADTTGTA